jgi:hypothetical protein
MFWEVTMKWLSHASIAVFLMLATTLPASADHFTWRRKPTVAKNQATCLGFGERAFNRLGIHSFEKKGDHYDARQGGALIVYTCVQTTAIIMVVSRDSSEADRLRDAIDAELAKEKPL